MEEGGTNEVTVKETKAEETNASESEAELSINEEDIAEWENTTNLKVFDVQGKLVFEQFNSAHTIELSTQSYAAGLYFIEISDKTSKVLEKLTVQH